MEKFKKNRVLNRSLVGLKKTETFILVMKPSINIFGLTSNMLVSYSNTCVEKEKLIEYLVKIKKQVEASSRTV
jgi:hypothetical protein